MVRVDYRCAGRSAPVSVWLLPEYDGWPRRQAELWFARRGLLCPAKADAAHNLAKAAPKPLAIAVKKDGQFDRVTMEYFDNAY